MQRILIPGQGGDLLIPRRRQLPPLEDAQDQVAPAREKTEWDKLRERSDALKLIADVQAKTAPTVDDLKKLDASGEGDAFPEKGVAGYANRSVRQNGLGFTGTVTEQHDAYLSYDVGSGEIREFRQRVVRDGEASELSIVKERDKTTYSREQGTWREVAVAYADGTYSSQKEIRITPEMQEMLKLQLAMKIAGGGSPFE